MEMKEFQVRQVAKHTLLFFWKHPPKKKEQNYRYYNLYILIYTISIYTRYPDILSSSLVIPSPAAINLVQLHFGFCQSIHLTRQPARVDLLSLSHLQFSRMKGQKKKTSLLVVHTKKWWQVTSYDSWEGIILYTWMRLFFHTLLGLPRHHKLLLNLGFSGCLCANWLPKMMRASSCWLFHPDLLIHVVDLDGSWMLFGWDRASSFASEAEKLQKPWPCLPKPCS